MYAAVVKLTIDTERAPAAAAASSNDILPRVRAAAGFVAGIGWTQLTVRGWASALRDCGASGTSENHPRLAGRLQV
jgi:hypothetical protein